MRLAAAVLAASIAGGGLANAAEPPRDELAAGFLNPPAAARPLVFWQWINGNVTEEGIRLDLEWMQRIGLAGALMFDIGFRTPPVPQYVEQRVGFGSPQWQKAVAFAASEAKRLGLLLGAQSSGGWSVSGGPSVAPEHAMKKLVWSETVLTPRSPAATRLRPVPDVSGPYQDLPIENTQFREPTRHGEVAVIALPLTESGPTTSPAASDLTDGSHARAMAVEPGADGNIVLPAQRVFRPRSVTVGVTGRRGMPECLIEGGRDGGPYDLVLRVPADAEQPAPVITLALPQQDHSSWRIRCPAQKAALAVTEARFDEGVRIDRVQEKAGFGVRSSYPEQQHTPRDAVIAVEQVIDLSAHMAADGTLAWRPAAGRWLVLRFGWSLTGRRVVPATPESIGLEVDKLDAVAVRNFANDFYDRYGTSPGALQMALTDSWEAGTQNWTPAMLEEFSERRGYDLKRWLPVLTGRIVGDLGRSERVLADFRRTLADLVADHHYGVLADVARRRGMSYFAQAAGTDLPMVVDGLQLKGRVDVPTGEFWYWPEGGRPRSNHVADVREAASAAHIYGKRYVAVESLTSQGEEAWAQGPSQWRRMIDRFFAEGMNRVILHTSAHQPFTDRVPGMTLRQYGQHFTRNETWAEDAGAWIQYLARTSFLLQQGRPAADLAIYLGEDAPVSAPFAHPGDPVRPPGYDYDFLNTEVLLQRLQVRGGRLLLPEGASYRALLLSPYQQRMSLRVIRRLRALVRDGAILIGPPPVGAVGLRDSDEEVSAIARQLWGEDPAGPRTLGRGRVYSNWEAAIGHEDLTPDVQDMGQPGLEWVHRSTPDAEIYFIANTSGERFAGTVGFRVHGRHVESWNAVDGSRSPVSYTAVDQTTQVRIRLAPGESRFLVFRGRGSAAVDVVEPARDLLLKLDGAWDVEFLDGRDAPRLVRLDAGVSWTAHDDAAIRFYSGRARYSRVVEVPHLWLKAGKRIELDLGGVGELARVRVNGRDLGVWWGQPFRRDITDALRAGGNQLEITITNYWVNRLIGDEQPGARRFTFAPLRPYDARSPLRPSGMLGPVELVSVTPGTIP